MREAGLTVRWLAGELEMAVRTLWGWLAAWSRGLLGALRRSGKQRSIPERVVRRAVLELLWAHPGLGSRRIARLVPGLSRRVVADWKERLRQRRRRAIALDMGRCLWHVPGSAWAMDHTEVAVGSEGKRQVLVVRDLASGAVLSTSPALEGTAEEVAGVLEWLFVLHGAPLVLKSDNGSPLVARAVREVLERWGVVALRSPPRRPAYNGAAERGLGWWKVLVDGCVGVADGLEQARLLANALPRERRPSASAVWGARKAISNEERQRFLAAYAGAYQEERERLDMNPEDVPPGSRADATIGRRAARAALCELNYLTIRRR